MKLNFNILNVSFFLILTGIFFLPFNSWDGISFLGEYYRDSCVLFFLLAFFPLLFKKKIKLPFHSPIFYSLIIFLVWALLTTLINFETVIDNSFKQTSGIVRFLRQYFSLILAALILPITFYNSFLNIDSKRLIYLIRKAIYYSFIVVIVYAIIEILVVKFNMINLKKEKK